MTAPADAPAEEPVEKPLTRKQRAIFEAALDVFSEQGFARTATAEIAKRAGVAEGTIFRTWRTKRDLLSALVTPVILKLVSPWLARELEGIAESDELTAFVRALYKSRIEGVVAKHPRAVRILLQEIAFHPELQQALKDEAGAEFVPPLLDAIGRFQQRGVIRSMPREAVLRLLVVNFAGLLVSEWFTLPGADPDPDAELDRTVAFVCRGLQP